MKKFVENVGVTALFALALFAFSISPAFAPLGGGGGGGGGQATTQMDCDAGQSLQAAVDSAKDGDTIEVSGTCNERVTVTTGNITIDGLGTAIIDGTGLSPGSLFRVRALNVRILNLTVQNGTRSGLLVGRSASATIQGVTSKDNGSNGILVNQAAYALIGAGSGSHPTAGNPLGNHIFGNGGNGISVHNGANADIFHNLITGNNRGISISNAGSADIDANVITGNADRGLGLSENGAARLSSDVNHHDTGLGNARPVVDPENNLIELNGEGLRCRRGGAANGNEQNFGVGNPGTGGTPHSNDALIAGDCHVRNTVF